MMNKKELSELIKTSEGYNLEFKETLNSSIVKEICAFANASGGRIILGVKDNLEVLGYKLTNRDISRIQDIARNMDPVFSVEVEQVEELVVIYVPEGKNKPYACAQGFFVRVGANSQKLNRDEIKKFFQENGGVVFDEKFIDFDFKDFSNEAYDRFLKKAKIDNNLDYKQLLSNLGFFRNNKLNYSGILLFSKDITKYLRNATIQCVLYQGTSSTIIDKKEFSRDLLSNFEDAIKYIKSKLNTEYVIKSTYRDEYLELPEEALREALINSIVHRDYFSTAPILININIESVKFLNPVIMDLSLTVDDLMKGSYPHNMFLFSNLERIDLVEKAGSGFLRIKKAMEKYELPMANIYFSKRLFEVTFRRPDLQINSYKRRVIDGKGFEYARKDLQKDLDRDLQKDLIKLNKNQKIIVAEIQKNNFITQKELSKIVGINEKNIRNNITKLKNLNIIKRVGPAKGGHWEVIK